MPKNILIIAGEASGDLYGAHLVRSLKKRYPGVNFLGVGGTKMKEAGVEIIHPIGELAIIGVSEIFSKLGKIKKLFSLLRSKLDEKKIDLAILVNYPGFNLNFAKVLKKKNIPVVFYSSPQVWVWGKWRIKNIKRCVDKMVVLLKFEEEFYRKNGVDAEFVGHPLVDIVKKEGGGSRSDFSDGDKKIISLLPGSRKSEVKNVFSTMLRAAEIIHSKNKNVQFLITKHPELPLEIYQKTLERFDLPAKIIDGKVYDCLSVSDLAIMVSGSVTLEATILKVPMIITNRLSFLTVLLFVLFVRSANVGLVNIIAGRRIMPEILQYQATPRNLAKEALDILSNNGRYKKMKEDLESVNNLIGPSGASDRAAEIISKMIGQG